VVAQEITVIIEYSTSQVYAIIRNDEYKGQLTGRFKISVVSAGK
jgi:hypothetical protein